MQFSSGIPKSCPSASSECFSWFWTTTINQGATLIYKFLRGAYDKTYSNKDISNNGTCGTTPDPDGDVSRFQPVWDR